MEPSSEHTSASSAPSTPRSPYVDAVRRAWRLTGAASDPHTDALRLALHALGKDGRARGASITSLLQALDRLAGTRAPRHDTEPGFDRVREWAGTELIRAYYGQG